MNTYETAGMNMACFESILKMTQGELKEYLVQQLRKYGYEPVCKNGFLYAEGTVPVLLVAHLDTVHTHQPDIICRSEDGRYLMSPYGIGGDDRAGVYMILLLMRKLRCHILFVKRKKSAAWARGNLPRASCGRRSTISLSWIGAGQMTPYSTTVITPTLRSSFAASALRKTMDRSATSLWSRRIWILRLSISAQAISTSTASMR